MALPDSYTAKPNTIRAYFEAMLDAEAPERFTQSFLENLEFKSTNDRRLHRWLAAERRVGGGNASPNPTSLS